MKLSFISNYFNHHQRPTSEAFASLCEEYSFIETSVMSDERKNLGYGESNMPSYVKKFDASSLSDFLNSDVSLSGNVKEEIVQKRIRQNKLLFRYSERLFKNGREPLKFPIRLFNARKNNPQNAKTYLLCASAYTSADYKKFGLFKNKAYKWGYFPETKKYDSFEKLYKKKKKLSVLWCGRFLDWKHPDLALSVLKRLKGKGYDFDAKFIGAGPLEETLKRDNPFKIEPPKTPAEIREEMEKTDIFLFTSDFKEGWGAVLNEAMNSGCAVVASHACGSVPYLIENGKNGYIFKSEDEEDFYKKLKALLEDDNLRYTFSKNAYETIINEWNAEVAAKRLLTLSERILEGEETPNLFESGPCSRAKILKNSWF